MRLGRGLRLWLVTRVALFSLATHLCSATPPSVPEMEEEASIPVFGGNNEASVLRQASSVLCFPKSTGNTVSDGEDRAFRSILGELGQSFGTALQYKSTWSWPSAKEKDLESHLKIVFKKVCSCVHVCVGTCIGAGTCAHVCACSCWGPRPLSCLLYFLEAVSVTGLEFLDKLGWLAGTSQGSTYLCLPSTAIINTDTHTQL